MTKTVSGFIIEQLAVWDVKYVFGLPGTSALGLVEAVRKSNQLQFIQVRHEETAALAASAYSKLTGEIGVCLSIAGPGATNLITGLFDAKMDKTPVIALTGQVKRTFIGPGTFQEIDQEALFNPVAVFNKTICTREQSKELTSLAIKYACTCQGVAHLAVPNDVQKEEWTEQPVSKENFIPLTRILPDKEVILEAQRLLNQAQAPVIIAGFGAKEAQKEVLALSEKMDAPVATTFRAKGLISEFHPYSLGALGKTGSPVARKIVQRADLLMVIGSSFSEQTSVPLDKDIVQIDLNPIHLSKTTPVKLPLWGDSKTTLRAILDGLPAKKNASFIESMAKEKQSWLEKIKQEADAREIPIRPQYLVKTLEEIIPEEAIITIDVGDNGFWMGRNFRSKGQTLLMSGYLGTMGFGLPAALAASLAYKDKKVFCLTGDGGFTQVMGDFLTLVRYNLPVVVVVFDNRELAMITVEQKSEGYPVFATELQPLDFVGFAHSAGGIGLQVNTPEELQPALKEAVHSNKPVIVDVLLEPRRIF